MSDAHYLTIIHRSCSHFETGWQRILVRYERMITGCLEWVCNIFKEPIVRILNGACLSVSDLFGIYDLATKCMNNALMPEADS
jgi:hypothetical protein